MARIMDKATTKDAATFARTCKHAAALMRGAHNDWRWVAITRQLTTLCAKAKTAEHWRAVRGAVAIFKARNITNTRRLGMQWKRNAALAWAAQRGHLAVVKFFVGLPGVDPGADDNEAIQLAAENGHLAVVKYLAGLSGADPAARDCIAIRLAAERGHLDVVKFLVGLPSVDPTACDNYAIRWAAVHGHLDVVQFLKSIGCVLPR